MKCEINPKGFGKEKGECEVEIKRSHMTLLDLMYYVLGSLAWNPPYITDTESKHAIVTTQEMCIILLSNLHCLYD